VHVSPLFFDAAATAFASIEGVEAQLLHPETVVQNCNTRAKSRCGASEFHSGKSLTL
jgi:hypothetical protein